MPQLHVGEAVPLEPASLNIFSSQVASVVECKAHPALRAKQNLSDVSSCAALESGAFAGSKIQKQRPFPGDVFFQLGEARSLSGSSGVNDEIVEQEPSSNCGNAFQSDQPEQMQVDRWQFSGKVAPYREPHLLMTPEFSNSSLHVPYGVLTLGDVQSAAFEGEAELCQTMGSAQSACVFSEQIDTHALLPSAPFRSQTSMCYAPIEPSPHNAGFYLEATEQTEPVYVLMGDPGLLVSSTFTSSV